MNSKENFFRKLLELCEGRGTFFMEKWERLLPFNEMLIHRFAKDIRIGRQVRRRWDA